MTYIIPCQESTVMLRDSGMIHAMFDVGEYEVSDNFFTFVSEAETVVNHIDRPVDECIVRPDTYERRVIYNE